MRPVLGQRARADAAAGGVDRDVEAAERLGDLADHDSRPRRRR